LGLAQKNTPLVNTSLKETSMSTPNSNTSNNLVVKLSVALLMHNAHINQNETPIVDEYKQNSTTLWQHGIIER
jgi:hypothetical protein